MFLLSVPKHSCYSTSSRSQGASGDRVCVLGTCLGEWSLGISHQTFVEWTRRWISKCLFCLLPTTSMALGVCCLAKSWPWVPSGVPSPYSWWINTFRLLIIFLLPDLFPNLVLWSPYWNLAPYWVPCLISILAWLLFATQSPCAGKFNIWSIIILVQFLGTACWLLGTYCFYLEYKREYIMRMMVNPDHGAQSRSETPAA